MQVVTYECEETAEETVEMAEEAMALIQQMGLEGQQQLIAPPTQDEVARRIPYREMAAEEKWVFETVCPYSRKLREYSRSPIPLRVLQVASHAASLGVFAEILVWAAEPQKEPDPVLVACIGDHYSSDLRYFILARWGEALDEWPAMLRKATELFCAKVKAKFAEIRAEIERDCTAIDELSVEELRRKGLPDYYR